MDFKTLTTVSAVLLALLGSGWLFKGTMMMTRWRLEPNTAALLIGRRLGTVYLGLAVLIGAVRGIPAGDAQWALCLGAAAFLSLLALIGVYEFVNKRVGPAIWASILVEVLLAFGYLALMWP